MGQTVNLLAYAFVGSIPTRPTNKNTLNTAFFYLFVL